MVISENYILYNSRNEPEVLTRLKFGEIPSYPSIRNIQDKEILEVILNELNHKRNKVILSWITPPYGKIVGYGLYSRDEAKKILLKSRRENWVFPKIGRIYDTTLLEEKLSFIY